MHRGLKSLLAVTGIALAGCSAPSEPQVTFYSHGSAAEVAPASYCDATGENCIPPPEDPVGELRVPERAPLQISTPKEVAEAPWQVAFIYQDPEGRELEGRSPVFAPNERHSYTLKLPPEGTRLKHVEVQQFSAMLVPSADGGIQFGIGGSWIVNTQ